MTKVFLSYARSDGESAAERLAKFLVSEEIKIWQDLRDIGSGESVWPQIEQALEHADHLIVIVTQTAIRSEYIHREWKAARRYGATIVPVLAEDIDRATLPRWLRRTEEIYRLDNSHRQKEFLATLYAPTKGLRSVWHDGFATKNMVSRPEKLAEVKQHLLSEDRDPVAISSVLRGRGGFGKSILASAVAQDDDIRNGYIDGVFWVTLGKEAQNVVPQLETLNLLISGKPMGTTDANTAAEELARLLDHRDVLVILDDVWTEAQLRPFLKVTRNASLLITTQQREIVEDAVQIDVEQLTGQEALAVLSRGLNPAPDERTSLQNFADEHWRWAQLLAICNHAILKRMKRGGRLEAVLTDVRQALRTGQQIGRDDRDLTLQAALDLSLSDMEPDLRDKLLLLAALDEDTEVPTDVLANLWDVELFTAQDICIELEIRSLLQPVDLTKPVAVHDNVLWFLKLRSSADETREAHKRFLDKNRPETGVWKDTQSTYMWHHVITHMRGAGLEGQADELLVDYAFLKAKLNAVGSAALYSGFLETRSIDVERVAGAVGVAVPALARNSSRLAWLLSERLRSEEAGKIQDLVTHATADMSNISGKWPILQPVGPEVLRISGHEDWVRSVAFSPDGRRIVSGAHDKTLRIWDTRSGDQLQVLRGHEDLVTSVAFSPDGSRIVSGSDDDTLRIWDARSGAQLQVLRGHEGSVTSVAFSPDGRRIVSGSRDDTLRIWDARSGDQMQVLQGHESSVYSVAFSLDGRRIVSGSNDNTLRIWDARSGDQLQVLRGHEGLVTSVAFSPDGRRIVSGAHDNTLRIWAARSGDQLQVLQGHESPVTSVAFSPDGHRIVSGAHDNTLRIWAAQSGDQLQVLHGHEDYVRSVAFSPDGRRIVSGSDDDTLRIWNARSGDQLQVLRGHEGLVTSVAFSPDGRRIVSGAWDGTLRIWEARSGDQLQVLQGHEGDVSSVSFSPDGRRIVSGSTDRSLRIWDARSGAQLQVLQGHEFAVSSVAFSPDGHRIVSGSWDKPLIIWDARSGDQMQVLQGHESSVYSVAFSLDGRRIVSGSNDNTLRIWDARSGDQLQVLRGHEGLVTSVAFSPDGRRIVSGSFEKTLRIWDARSGGQLQVLQGHEGPVNSVAFSLDGRRIVSGSNDNTLRTWDADTGQHVLELYIDSRISTVAWHGKVIACGTASGLIGGFSVSFDTDEE